MPRYKLTGTSPAYVVDRLVQPGEEFEYDGNPGTAYEPLDNDARVRKEAYFRSKGGLAAAERRKRVLTEGAPDVEGALTRLADGSQAAPPAPPAIVTHHVPISADWESLDWVRQVALAARLGAPEEVVKKAEAVDFIRAEVDRRAAAGGPPLAPPAPPAT